MFSQKWSLIFFTTLVWYNDVDLWWWWTCGYLVRAVCVLLELCTEQNDAIFPGYSWLAGFDWSR
jgi:hypothetical protein